MPALAEKRKSKQRRVVKTRFAGFEKYEMDKVHLVEEIVGRLYGDKPDQTLAEISERSQIAVSTLRNLNSGKTLFPRTDTLWKMATACGAKIGLVK